MKKPHQEAFANALKEILDRRGLPSMNHGRVEAFADLMGGRAPSTVHRWLSGSSVPDAHILIEMAGVLNCTLDELFGRSPAPEKTPIVDVTYFAENLVCSVKFPQIMIDRRNRIGPFGILRIVGNEMDGHLDNNDCAIFDMGQTKINSGYCYVLEIGGKLIVRRLRMSISRKIDVLCENKFFPMETVESTEMVPYNPSIHAGDTEKPPILVRGLVIARHRFEH